MQQHRAKQLARFPGIAGVMAMRTHAHRWNFAHTAKGRQQRRNGTPVFLERVLAHAGCKTNSVDVRAADVGLAHPARPPLQPYL